MPECKCKPDAVDRHCKEGQILFRTWHAIALLPTARDYHLVPKRVQDVILDASNEAWVAYADHIKEHNK